MNIIQKSFVTYSTWIAGWSPASFGFFLQAILLFGLPAVLCSLAFLTGSRSIFIQTVLFLVGVLLAAGIPVERFIPSSAIARTWLFTLSLIVLAFLPAALPKVLTPRLGTQQKLCVVGYIILAGLFIANLCLKGGN